MNSHLPSGTSCSLRPRFWLVSWISLEGPVSGVWLPCLAALILTRSPGGPGGLEAQGASWSRAPRHDLSAGQTPRSVLSGLPRMLGFRTLPGLAACFSSQRPPRPFRGRVTTARGNDLQMGGLIPLPPGHTTQKPWVGPALSGEPSD